MKKVIVILFLIIAGILGCNKPDSSQVTGYYDTMPTDNVIRGNDTPLPLHISIITLDNTYEYDCVSVSYINYNSEDILSINTGECKCGIDFPQMSKTIKYFNITKK